MIMSVVGLCAVDGKVDHVIGDVLDWLRVFQRTAFSKAQPVVAGAIACIQ